MRPSYEGLFSFISPVAVEGPNRGVLIAPQMNGPPGDATTNHLLGGARLIRTEERADPFGPVRGGPKLLCRPSCRY